MLWNPKGDWNIHIDFFANFFEPYAPNGACTVPPESNFHLIDRLYRERALFLFKNLSPETANHIVGLMIFLNIDDSDREQFLFINSTGGGVMHGLAVTNTINFVLPDVHTICVGVAASMAAFILAGGSQTKRTAFPHAWRQWGFIWKKKDDYAFAIWNINKKVIIAWHFEFDIQKVFSKH